MEGGRVEEHLGEENAPVNHERRGFLFSLCALVSAPPVGLLNAHPADSAKIAGPFTPEEEHTLEAICEQIFPEDEFPGAKTLGVPAFIKETLIKSQPLWMKAYRAGLQALRETSYSTYSRPFEAIEFDEQTRLLSNMAEGKLTGPQWGNVSCREFFWMMRDHTLQGAFSHPRYGGNKDKAAWKMIGYDDWWA
jgi:gluconate 2-dehydrogenase gamma chain